MQVGCGRGEPAVQTQQADRHQHPAALRAIQHDGKSSTPNSGTSYCAVCRTRAPGSERRTGRTLCRSVLATHSFYPHLLTVICDKHYSTAGGARLGGGSSRGGRGEAADGGAAGESGAAGNLNPGVIAKDKVAARCSGEAGEPETEKTGVSDGCPPAWWRGTELFGLTTRVQQMWRVGRVTSQNSPQAALLGKHILTVVVEV